MRRTLLGLSIFLVFASGCASFKPGRNQFAVEKRWVRQTLEKEYLGGRRLHRFQPIITDSIVIVGNSIDGVVAYERSGVAERWRFPLKDGVESGAVLADGILYFGAGDGQFYALFAESGNVLWKYPMKAEGLAKPLVHGDSVYVLGGNNVVHALEAKTGKLLWTYNRREANNISIRGGSQPAVSGDLALIGFSDGALVALNRSSGSVVWETNLNRNKRFRDVDATPVVDGDTVYASSYDGSLYALSLSDGKIIWSIDDGGYEEVLIQGSTLFYSTSSGKVMAIDKQSGKIVWSKDNPQGIGTAPTLFKSVLMVGELNGALRFIDARSGDSLGNFQPGRGVTSRPTIDPKKGEVYFISSDANIFALRIGWRRFGREWPWE